MQSIVLLGTITKKEELKELGNEKSILNFVVADNNFGQSTFFQCVAWDKNAKNIDKYFSKGDSICLKLKYTNNTYESKDGGKKKNDKFYVESFAFFGKKEKNKNQKEDEVTLETNFEGFEIVDDDLPF